MPPRRLLCVLFAATITLTGCTEDDPPAPEPVPPSEFRLVAFDSCAQLAEDLRRAARKSVGPWGFDGGGIAELARGPVRRADVAAPAGGKAVAGPEFSGTNVHERGVDEPDLVKTDGRRIVTVTGGVLRVVDAASRARTGRLQLDDGPLDDRQRDYAGRDAELLLSGDRAVVLRGDAGPTDVIDYSRPAPRRTAEVLLIDLSGPPRVLSRFTGEGALVDARQTGPVARVVLRSTPKIDFESSDDDEDARLDANRKAIGKADAEAWLPTWSVRTGPTTEKGRVGCEQVARPAEYSGSSVLTVFTFDLAAGKLDGGDPVALVADGETVYGTPTSLYVANDQGRRSQRTEIFRFDTSGSGAPVYAAGGSVPGWLLNQYALSEWDGHLRVATTSDAADSSAVRVLKQRGRTLTEVGKVGGLGKGEQIRSVRFLADRGYVVTFRQTDPLYSLDLRDPARPAVTGELKITGYSAHLQPVGENRLIGVGQEADTRGRIQGFQVSLFDVGDPADPRRLAQRQVSDAVSEAEHDPHALLWWPDTRLLVVPMSEHTDGTRPPDNSALAVRVTDTGVEPVGELRHPRVTVAGKDGLVWSPSIRRTLVVGDVLWTVSDEGLQAARLSTLDQLAWVPNA